MERREFYLRSPLLQFAPALALGGLLFVPLIVFLARGGAQTSANDDAFLSGALAGFSFGTAAFAVLWLAVMAYSISVTRKRPYLVLDGDAFNLPGLKLTWGSIREIKPGNNFGLPCLRISTRNDDALIRQMRFPLKFIYALRRSLYGAPLVIPPVGDVQAADLRTLIEEYRASAAG